MGRFLIVSEEGSGTGLALRLKAEGHDVQIWFRSVESEHRTMGAIDIANEYSSGQTLVADCTGSGPLLDIHRDNGVPVVGGSSFADKLETDRRFGEEVFNRVGITVPQSREVGDWGDAAEAVREMAKSSSIGKVVLKPEGRFSGVVPSYVASDEEDALRMLDYFKRQLGENEVKLVVQEFVEGIDVSTEGWFNGEDWVESLFNHTIERKQLMDGNLGPSGGCSGNLVWFCGSDDPLVKQLLHPLTKTLRSRQYRGAIDVNAVVTKKDVYALEFTPRFGYDAFPTLLYALSDFDFGHFLDCLAHGWDCDVALRTGFGAGLRITVPPYPSGKAPSKEKLPLGGLDEDDAKIFYPYEVEQAEDGSYQTTGGFGVVGVVSCHADSITGAFSRCYQFATKLRLPNKQYRTDMAEQCLKDFRELRKVLGFASEGWLGVDFDGTLASYDGWSNDLGAPVPKMVQRVKRWLREGKEVRIVTARARVGDESHNQVSKLHDWSNEHLGQALEVTANKDHEMIVLYDDRAKEVVPNEGTLVA